MNPNPNETTTPIIRKTQVLTLWDRQRRMKDFYNLPGTTYIALGRQQPWTDPNDPNVSDTYPPIPLDTMTQIEDMIGMQRIAWKKFAKVYVSPTTEQKENMNTVYYKGLYYETTNDIDYAIENGFTSVMMQMTADRDQYFPIAVTFRQVGLYVMVGYNDVYLNKSEFDALPEDQKGHLCAVENFMPLTRQGDQLEKFFIIVDF